MRSEIVSWNPINNECGRLKASVYIKPTLDILKFFQKSPMYRAVVKISETNSCYDDHNVFAIINKSSDVPNCRQNFFNSTGLYVITLDADWYGYPLKNGYIEYMEGIVDDIIDYINPCKNVPSSPPPSSVPSVPSYEDKKTKEDFQDNINLDNLSQYIKDDIDNKNNKDDKGMDKTTLAIMGVGLLCVLAISMK